MSKVLKQLKLQRKIEGNTPELDLLFKVYKIVANTSNSGDDWSTLAKVYYHRYGKLSYECHIFYKPSDLLLSLKDYFLGFDEY